MTKPRYYTGLPPSRCDLCDRRLLFLMYDALVPLYGTWGNICSHCFTLHSCKLGTGKGHKYELQEDGRWMKIAGRIVLPVVLALVITACASLAMWRANAMPCSTDTECAEACRVDAMPDDEDFCDDPLAPAEIATRAAEAVAQSVMRGAK